MPDIFDKTRNKNGLSKRTENEVLRAQLELERSSFLPHWRDLGDYMLPRRPRFTVTDTNRGERRNLKIIDNTATTAIRTARAGMVSGITSPARQWFKLGMSLSSDDPSGNIALWLDDNTKRMVNVFLRSNLYNKLPTAYGDLITFATAAIWMEEDFKRVVRFKSIPIGSYSIGSSDGDKPDIYFREFRMTVDQVVNEFATKKENGQPDLSKFSTYIKDFWLNGQSQTWIDICHVVKPNKGHDPRKEQSKFKKYVSIYYEKGNISLNNASAGTSSGGNEEPLREKGYDFFPVLVPRWEVTGEDFWGTACPGMDALGDTKQLQTGEKRSMQAVEKKVFPSMVAPTRMKNARASLLPGDITYVDDNGVGASFRPAHEVDLSIAELEAKQEQTRARIKKTFYEDLFLMLANSDRRQITATEIAERKEEKLLALGPVLEQLNQDLLDPLIENTFIIMQRQGLISEPPEEIAGQEIKIEYISIMAQAQKLIGIGTIERYLGFINDVGTLYPEALKKADPMVMIDRYAENIGLEAGINRTTDAVEELIAEEQEALMRQQRFEESQQAASVAKDLSQADTGGENALNQLISQSQAGSLT